MIRNADAIPQELKDGLKFVSWTYGPPRANGKRPKVPRTPGTGRLASTTDPAAWGTLADALADVEAGRADGSGRVFTSEDPFLGIDLDDCRDPVTGAIDAWAQTIMREFNTYSEVSPSGTGVHLIGRGRLPGDGQNKKPIEIYDRKRFFTLTGNVVPGYEAIRDIQDEVTALHAKVSGQAAVLAPAPDTVATDATVDNVWEAVERSASAQVQQLLVGDWTGFASASNARWRLGREVRKHTMDPDTIEAILLKSDLFDASNSPENRHRKARHDAEKLVHTPVVSSLLSVPVMGNHHRDALGILANKALRASRLTAFIVVENLADRIAQGEQPGPHGYAIPAARYVEHSGQSMRTVLAHLDELRTRGLLDKHKIRERTTRTERLETLDGSTGEITTTTEQVRGTRERNYVRLPAGGLGEVITNLVAYGSAATPAGHAKSEAPSPLAPRPVLEPPMRADVSARAGLRRSHAKSSHPTTLCLRGNFRTRRFASTSRTRRFACRSRTRKVRQKLSPVNGSVPTLGSSLRRAVRTEVVRP